MINKYLKTSFSLIVSIALTLLATNSIASEFPLAGGDWTHEMGAEIRSFSEPGINNQEQQHFSFSYQGEYYRAWDYSSFTFKPFVNIDVLDNERRRFDFREFYWDFAADTWDVAIGFNKVYWGRLEFYNIVDIVNQTDLAVNQDEKFGQPMIKFGWENSKGLLEFLIITGFRERSFPGPDGRLGLPFPVDTNNSTINNSAEIPGIDLAVRWTQSVGNNTEISLSHFSGLSREPDFGLNFDLDNLKLIPIYETIEQTGLELEWLYEGWVVKFEAKNVSGQDERFQVLSAGVEFTFSDIFSTGHDITIIAEQINDSREEVSPSFLERDYAMGMRWAANDEAGSEALLGFLLDPETDERLVAIEGSRRFGENFKLYIRGNIIIERAREPTSLTFLEALDAARSNPLFADAFASDEFILFLVDFISSGDFIDFLINPSQLDPLTEQIEQFSDLDRKLNVLETEDYVEIAMTYYF